jgi:SAM-dependent methyltransferase
MMADWNDLFLNNKYINIIPQQEVYKFIKKIEGIFTERPLLIWDLCCGAGRHTILISKMGHSVYGSDISENGIYHTRKWLEKEGLKAELAISDMTVSPWTNLKFHGIICWDALHYNNISNIKKTVDIIYDNTAEGGMFLVSLLSTKGGAYGKGVEIEKDTFVRTDGEEAGVPHHYFDETGIRDLFRRWKIVYLVEQISEYIEIEPNYYETNPFQYTKWGVLVEK